MKTPKLDGNRPVEMAEMSNGEGSERLQVFPIPGAGFVPESRDCAGMSAVSEPTRNLQPPAEGAPEGDQPTVVVREIDREAALAAIDAEAELPGPMPDEFYLALQLGREACEEAFRSTVRVTKRNIRERVAALGEATRG